MLNLYCINKGSFSRLVHSVIIVVGLLLFQESIRASVNVADYGAVGDMQTLTSFSTTSDSADMVCPGANFSPADVNKLIEVFDAGIYRNPSNETLFAYITAVSSESNITVSVPAGATATGLTGVYGTDNQPCFSNAIAACAFPMDTVIIPAGNYLIVPKEFFFTGLPAGGWPTALRLKRGGITFAGQDNVILTGVGGWKTGGGTSACRGRIFAINAPLANNYPLVFSNLTLDGGVAIGNIHDRGFPANQHTGLGWDMSHHWIQADLGSGPFLTSLVMINCTVQHWRGEMMEASEGSPNLYLNATNCVFTDGNASCINNFAHACYACTFSNVNQAEEFYRSYATNQSFMVNCIFNGMNGCAIALNGGIYSGPYYTISGNTFVNCPFAVETAPAVNVIFTSNTVSATTGLGIGVAGYQGGNRDGTGTINSNIVVAYNTFNGTDVPLVILGGGQNSATAVYFFSNQVNNAKGIVGGYGYATSLNVFQNTGADNLSFGNQLSFSGQYALDLNNAYDLNPYTSQGQLSALGGNTAQTNMFSYAYGARGQINANSHFNSVFALDDTQPTKIPAGAQMVIVNRATPSISIAQNWTWTGNCNYPVYLNAGLKGTPVILGAGQTATFYWNKNGWASTTVPSGALAPPTKLR